MCRVLFLISSFFLLACEMGEMESPNPLMNGGTNSDPWIGTSGGTPGHDLGAASSGDSLEAVEQDGDYSQKNPSGVVISVGENVDSEDLEPTEVSQDDSTNGAGALSGSVTLVSPVGLSSTNPVTFQVQTSGSVTQVRYLALSVDGGTVWPLGESSSAGNDFAVTYMFQQIGQRQIVVQGLSSNGVVVAESQAGIVVSPESGDEPTYQGACPAGQWLDCNGVCFDMTWVGDGYCDDGSSYHVVLDCPIYENDGGDCAASACANGYIEDCNGLCAQASWLGDGTCDDGTQYAASFMCESLQYDQGDCATGQNSSSGSSSNAGSSGNTGVGGVPYFYQYNNALHPGASCQNTSIAMVLKYYGWSGTPDTITSAWGKNVAQSPGGLANVFNSYAEASGIPERLSPHTNGSIAGMKALLAQGKPVIVHGYFTSAGHVVVVTGYANGVYTVNDPAGKWNQSFKGGYPYGYNSGVGKGITYSAAAVELAISSLNGSNYAPLWYHEVIQ